MAGNKSVNVHMGEQGNHVCSNKRFYERSFDKGIFFSSVKKKFTKPYQQHTIIDFHAFYMSLTLSQAP